MKFLDSRWFLGLGVVAGVWLLIAASLDWSAGQIPNVWFFILALDLALSTLKNIAEFIIGPEEDAR